MNFYHYQEIGFDGVRLFDGVTAFENNFGKGLEIRSLPVLHSKILEALCSCNVKLSGGMVFAMRTELELSQSEMGSALGLSGRQMLSLYERGEREMPLTTQQALKRMVLSKIAGSRMSLGLFDRQLVAQAPTTFDFQYGESSWLWINSPHALVSTFNLLRNNSVVRLVEEDDFAFDFCLDYSRDEFNLATSHA